MTRILLLGGTTEAGLLARALAEAGLDAVFSYAGRTAEPVAQPLPLRIGGFGGVAGLAAYLRAEGFSHVIDATHPFAAQMSWNAFHACGITQVALSALERPPWEPAARDIWHRVGNISKAVQALPATAQRVFLAIGKQNLAEFAAAPQHHYLLRLVDPPGTLPLPYAEFIIDRGPFRVEADIALLREHRIDWIVAKNSGGAGAEAKLIAARSLGLPVVMIDRPTLPERRSLATVADVMEWLGHSVNLGV